MADGHRRYIRVNGGFGDGLRGLRAKGGLVERLRGLREVELRDVERAASDADENELARADRGKARVAQDWILHFYCEGGEGRKGEGLGFIC